MNIYVKLDKVYQIAMEDDGLRQKILQTRENKDSLQEFCHICKGLGYELYPMEFVVAGEEAYAAMRRSTNGGGENSPMLEGEDDVYELFLARLELK